MGHPCGYFLGASFSKICSFTTVNLNVKVFCEGKSSISRSFVAAIYQNKPLSPVSFLIVEMVYCDKSGFPLQACSSSKVCAEKVMKRSLHMSSSSKTLITTLQCISASGSVLPSAAYFPGKSLV